MPALTDFPLTPKQAAEYVGVHEDTLKRWAREGKVRALLTPGNWWRFNHADLDELIAGRISEPTDTTEAAS